MTPGNPSQYNPPPPQIRSLGDLRVVHEVIDLPHGHAPHVDEEDESQQHQVVFRGHPQNKLQVEGVELGQQELRTQTRTRTFLYHFVCLGSKLFPNP